MKNMFFAIIGLVLTATFNSCKKDDNPVEVYSEATYSIEVTGKWASPDFTVPANVHFTNFVGMVHNAQPCYQGGGKRC
jgi:hypothetical protein